MIKGRAFVLVVGGSDTGRSPMVAALLRQRLPQIEVRSAGVVSHEGESPPSEVFMALEHLGARLGNYTARPIDLGEIEQAELLLAVDRGIARVLQSQYPQAKRIMALSDLARSADIIDPHRMPLGLWISAARDFDTQLNAALPQIEQYLQLDTSAIAPPTAAELAAPVPVAAATPAPTQPNPLALSGDRAEPLTRITRLLETAIVLPEIVDWDRLRSEVSEQLRTVASQASGPADFTPAATMMLDGLLAQTTTIPSAARLELLRTLVQQLAESVDGSALAQFGGEAARWQTL